MSATAALLGILGALLIGAISPGPSFVIVSRIALTNSRLNALAAALGMGLGGALYATLAIVGLGALLLQVEWLYLALKLAGGAFLVYLGIRIRRGASEPLTVSHASEIERGSPLRAFWLGFITQISNPKTAVVYASIFAALLPSAPPTWLLISLPPLVLVVETSWYAVVALALSAKHPRAFYLGFKSWIDRAAGLTMGALGTSLIVDGVKSQSA